MPINELNTLGDILLSGSEEVIEAMMSPKLNLTEIYKNHTITEVGDDYYIIPKIDSAEPRPGTSTEEPQQSIDVTTNQHLVEERRGWASAMRSAPVGTTNMTAWEAQVFTGKNPTAKTKALIRLFGALLTATRQQSLTVIDQALGS